MKKRKLIVVGGGFAGAKIARKMEKMFNVTLIDDKDYYEFTPGILRTLNYPEHLKKMQRYHIDYLKMAEFIKGKVTKINSDNLVVDKKKKLHFDYLVIATGSRYEAPIKERNMILVNRGEELKEYETHLEKANKIIIVGGGPVGVELAGEIITRYPKKDVTIIEMKDKIIHRNNPKSISYAERFFAKKMVKIICNHKEGHKIDADMFFLCTGIKPSSEFLEETLLDERGYVKVNEFLQMQDKNNIFVCGDVASLNEEKLAQGAEKQAGFVIRNIKRLEAGKELKKYKSRKMRPMIISLGKWDGIFECGNLVMHGKIPALMKWLVEKKTMLKYGKI